MENSQSTVDSNYESVPSGSSVSSISISLSSETTDDHLSTSGCSSMHLTGSLQSRKNKKQKVKAYIRQLKSMISLCKGRVGKKTGTLTALQHVVDELKILNDLNEEPKFIAPDMVSSICLHGTSATSGASLQMPEGNTIILKQDGCVQDVASSLLDILGSPKECWLGHPLSKFTSHKDITVINNLSLEDTSTAVDDDGREMSKSEDTQKKSIYFRLRHFKGLKGGYGLNRPDTYTMFHANVSIKIEDYANGHEVAEGKKPESPEKIKIILLSCTPLNSAYTSNNQPMNTTFHTRHTLDCNISFVSTSAYTLLGFLPQDLNGLSILKLYHPDDLDYLYTVYQQVMSLKGKPFKSDVYRLRVGNNCWIQLETEWSSFINPWSKHVEYIIGQHVVIRGPKNPNVFEDAGSQKYPCISEFAQQQFQRKIQELFQKPVTQEDDKIEQTVSLSSKMPEDGSPTKVYLSSDSFVDEAINYREENNKSPAVSLSSSPQTLYDTDTSITYEQLNYSYTIKKFLLSQPKTFTCSSSIGSDGLIQNMPEMVAVEEKKYPLQQLKANISASLQNRVNTAVPEFVVDIQVPHPPSFGSSTKVLLSDTREAASPTNEYFKDAILHKDVPSELSISNDDKQYMPIPLTPEILRMHTKLQERLYVKQATHDYNFFDLHHGRSSDTFKAMQRLKRHLVIDENESQRNYCLSKVPRLDDSADIYTSGSNPMINMDITTNQCSSTQFSNSTYFTSHNIFSQTTQPGFNGIRTPLLQSNMGLYSQMIPIIYDPKSVNMNDRHTTNTDTCCSAYYSSNSNLVPGMHWPYYSQASVPFLPQPMNGFYQPLAGVFQPFHNSIYGTQTLNMNKKDIALESKTTPSLGMNSKSTVRKPPTKIKHHQKSATKQMQKLFDSSDNFSSQEDTSSSLWYLLESGSFYTCSPLPDEVENGKKPRNSKKLPMIPFWLQNVTWSNDIQMKYTLSLKHISYILKEDRVKLSKYLQAEPVQEQLKELKISLMKPDCMPTFNEEEDYLIFYGEFGPEQLSVEGGVNSYTSVTNHTQRLEEEMETEIISFQPKDQASKIKEPLIQKSTKGSPMPVKVYSSDNEQTKSEDSFKNSSDVTSSDQWSNEEAGSSLKESDAASKESDGPAGTKKDKKERKSRSIKTKYNVFDKLFVPLQICVPKKPSRNTPFVAPMSVTHSEENRNAEMNCQIIPKKLSNILEADRKRMQSFMQPGLVQEQLQMLLNEEMDSKSLTDVSERKPLLEKRVDSLSAGNTDQNITEVNINDVFGKLFLSSQFAPAEDCDMNEALYISYD